MSTTAKPISGCQVDFLGHIDYLLVASPEFKRQYFAKNIDIKKILIESPSVIFDAKDKLHARYLNEFFEIHEATLNTHIIPSVHGFKQFALMGYGYGLIPAIDIKKELQQKQLVELFPSKRWRMALFWYSWQIQTEQYKAFNALVLKVARRHLS